MTRDLKGKTILLVHAGSMRKKFIFDVLKKLEVNLICLNRQKTPLAEPYVAGWVIADLNDIDACAAEVGKFLQANSQIKIDGVLTFWDECILLAAKLSETLNLAGIPLAVAEVIKNKYLFRDACEKKKLRYPEFKMLRGEQDIINFDPNWRFPLVIKPVYGACSAFVVRVENKEELLANYQQIKKNIRSFWLAPEWTSLEILVEEYIEGDEVDVDILLQNGEIKYFNIIDNEKTNEPYFVETGWSCPTALSEPRKRSLLSMAKETLDRLGVKDGCIHFEAKSNRNGIATPIEINLRMGGGEVYLYSKLVWGVDLVENAARIAVGLPVMAVKPARPRCHLISKRFLSDVTCRVVKIEVDKELEKQNYFVDLYFETGVGQIFKAPPNGYDHSIGILTIRGETAGQVKKNLDLALGEIKITTENI